ncbi:MAG: hypothetical protein KC416_04825 [Myxococcales bacterium]|nr:hypothetical protein [Myxococcales bacterium]
MHIPSQTHLLFLGVLGLLAGCAEDTEPDRYGAQFVAGLSLDQGEVQVPPKYPTGGGLWEFAAPVNEVVFMAVGFSAATDEELEDLMVSAEGTDVEILGKTVAETKFERYEGGLGCVITLGLDCTKGGTVKRLYVALRFDSPGSHSLLVENAAAGLAPERLEVQVGTPTFEWSEPTAYAWDEYNNPPHPSIKLAAKETGRKIFSALEGDVLVDPEPADADANCGLGACTFVVRPPCPGEYALDMVARAPDLPLPETKQSATLSVSEDYVAQYHEVHGGTPDCP